MATLSTLVAMWRLIVRFRISKWLGVSDWLMAGGVVRTHNLFQTHPTSAAQDVYSQTNKLIFPFPDPKLRGLHPLRHLRSTRWPRPSNGRPMVAQPSPNTLRATHDLHLPVPKRVRYVSGQALRLRVPARTGLWPQLPDPDLDIYRRSGTMQFRHDADTALCILPAVLFTMGFQCKRRVLACGG